MQEKPQDSRPDSPVISVLLATVKNRADKFALLHAELQRQAEGKPVELVVACDNKEISIGKKRQNLLEASNGEYICYVDDDDWVSDDYVDSLLGAIRENPGVHGVGFLVRCTVNGSNPQLGRASVRYKKWGDHQDGVRYVRPLYHKTPVLRSIALRVGFQDIRYGEDKIYSDGVMKHATTEAYVDKVIYHYRYSHEPFAQKYGIINSRLEKLYQKGQKRPVV